MLDRTIATWIERLKDARIDFVVTDHLRRDADHDTPLLGADENHSTTPKDTSIVEARDIAAGIGADHATRATLAELRRHRDAMHGTVCEIGCGTGVMAVWVASRTQAKSVIATDIDPDALRLAEINARNADVDIDLRLGHLLEPLADIDRLHWVVANLPHKPNGGRDDLPLAQDGGRDGDHLFSTAVPEIARRQHDGDHLVFFLHSLPNRSLLRRIGRDYELELVSWKIRWIVPGEYSPALIETFRRRHREGLSFFVDEETRHGFVACVWHARRRSVAS